MRMTAPTIAAVVALIATPSFAADLAARSAKPAASIAPTTAAFSWAGFYAGVQAGYQWDKVSGPFQNAGRTGSGPYDFTSAGGLFGGYVGYNYQFNALVIGLEGDINAAFGNEKTDSNVLYGGTTYYDIKARETYTGDVRVRLGYAVDRFLPYVAGGVAFGNVKTSYAFAGESEFLRKQTDRVGWTIGAGLEYAFTDHIVGRVEYRYTDLGKKDFTATDVNTYDEVKLHSNAVLAGVAYKF